MALLMALFYYRQNEPIKLITCSLRGVKRTLKGSSISDFLIEKSGYMDIIQKEWRYFQHLDYGDIFYMSANAEHLEDIRKLQYRALRICLKANIRTARVELLTRANLPLLAFRRTVHLRNYMYKRSKIDTYLDKAEIQTRAHTAPLFKIPKSDTKTYDKSILVKGGTEWNSLSAEIRNKDTYNNFKLHQKCWLYSMVPN